MGMFDKETILPGVITEIEAELSVGYDTSSFNTTDSVVVIGTAFDGPVGRIVPLYNPEHASYVFGKTYNSKSKKEASLVAGVQDAWDRGCRTIYAVRVGGVDLYKDFDFCIDNNMKLRVSAANPSNLGKDVYMLYDNTAGAETIKLYKPASRATIAEKMQGLVTSENIVLVTEIRLNQDYGIGRDGKLSDLIQIVNNHQYNNVLKLSVVNMDGIDVTNSIEAYELAIGSLYPGVYFIGRDKSNCASYTDRKFKLVVDETSPRPYAAFDGNFYRKLAINTDVSAPYPIYAESLTDLRNILKDVNVSMKKSYDFLEVSGLADRAFAKNSKDYEEANLSSFEIYKRLGSGFAITAYAERRVDGAGKELTPRIKEAKMDDVNRVKSIKDGIYIMLENAKVKYRALVCGSADETISGKLPKPKDFLVSVPEEISVLKDLIRVTPKVDPKSTTSPKAYKLKFETLSSVGTDTLNDVYIDSVMQIIPKISVITDLDKVTVDPGTFVMLVDPVSGKGTLVRTTQDSYETLTGAGLENELFIVDGNIYQGTLAGGKVVFEKVIVTPGPTAGLATFKSKEYVLGESCDEVFVFQVIDSPTAQVSPLGDLKTMLSENTDKTLIYAQNNYLETNSVVVKSAILNTITVEEFVELLNEHEVLSRLFSFKLTTAGGEIKDEIIADAAAGDIDVKEYLIAADRKVGYDYSLYIPYRTTDNFARQLAQHCIYTELKTAPTWGFIGCQKMLDTGITIVSNKVNSVFAAEFDLYAKTDVGRNMFNKDNMPYPIGKNISVTLMQYFVTTPEGYRYVSNGAAGYAGMVSTLPLDQSSTSQSITLPSLMYELTNYQLGLLTQKGIVTVKQSFDKGIVVTDGITMAPSSSVFRRLSVSRIIGAVEELIRQSAEPFIGKQNHQANRNALQTAIKSNLDKVVGKLLEKYTFNLVVDPKLLKLSYIEIDYDMVPIFEIRQVRNRINVKEQ